MRRPYIILCMLAGIAMVGCKSEKEKKDGQEVTHEIALNEVRVDTMVLHLQPFDKQIVCNGRLRALSASVLTFPRAGYISGIYVREGERVKKGDLIATIDRREAERQLDKAQHELERARVQLVDKLIGLGYKSDMSDVPAEERRRAEVTSGYYSASYDEHTAKRALEDCELRAPLNGRIASIEAKLHQTSDKVCTLIDDSKYDVEFKVLESELADVRIGASVTVTPFVDDSLHIRGIIEQINPRVDEKGLVKVVARIAGGRKVLMDGMNMRIVTNQRVERAFVVPKDAVVERDGYHVIFLLCDGHAVWTYVDILHSNISSYAITGCARKDTHIGEGDIVITSGNLNLADGTEVMVN